MKPNLKFFWVYLLTGVIIMLNGYGCSPALKLEKYSSKDPELNITMDYISGWLHSETRGSYGSYVQALFYEPQRNDKNIKAAMVVTTKKVAAVNLTPVDIKTYAEDLISKRMRLTDAKVLLKEKIQIFNSEAISIELGYKKPDKLNRIDAKLVSVKEKVVIFRKNDQFYILRYENTAEEFSRLAKVFDRIIQSIKFKK